MTDVLTNPVRGAACIPYGDHVTTHDTPAADRERGKYGEFAENGNGLTQFDVGVKGPGLIVNSGPR